MPQGSSASLQQNFLNKDILSLDQFDPQSLLKLFSITSFLKSLTQSARTTHILQGTLTTLLFYEPSSRTFGSFATAVKRLGGQTLDILDPQQFSSVAKGETLQDTIRVFETYSDLIVLRHPIKGTATQAAKAAASVPIINAGDGVGEHPTQALLDLYTIYERFGRLDNLTVLFAGDLLNGRTVHSLLRGLALFPKNTVYLLAPDTLKLSVGDKQLFTQRGLRLHEIKNEKEIPKTVQVWYWTRVQKERFTDLTDYEKVKNTFIVTPGLMKKYAAKDMILMHPLPRVGEILPQVDKDPRAVYLRSQIQNGVYVRMALISLVLGRIK
ncbi:MAG TPA: aspartate carbamoyltransferase [Patescibacteria group bacterium]|nr:aspartate carbamoyltransferase [Patescibacteria group bacterium]